MEWSRADRLLRKQDCGTFKFGLAPLPSTVFRVKPEAAIVSQFIESDEEWIHWLRKDEDTSECRAPDGITLLCCGRAQPKYKSMEAAYLPFPEGLCERVASALQIHGSIARVINRSLRAAFQHLSTKTANSLPLLLYNCRSSAEWEDDLGLSVTYTPSTRTTCAVVYGCSNVNRDFFRDRLSSGNCLAYHPLTLPMIFAEIERERAFTSVKVLVRKLVQRVVDMSRVSPVSVSSSSNKSRNYSTGSEQSKVTTESPEELMKLWLSVSALKRGLETWKTQLEKMLLHCQHLVFEGPIEDEATNDDLKQTGERIEQKLVELIGEYEEKIRECTTVIDGMVLATQLEWNNIGQEDARTNVYISRYSAGIATSTASDSKQMRSIALLTMVFLPATFVATLFSMGFFNWTPEKGQNIVSPHIWMYFVVTAGFTCATMCTWFLYSWQASKKDGTDEEKQLFRAATSLFEKDAPLSPTGSPG